MITIKCENCGGLFTRSSDFMKWPSARTPLDKLKRTNCDCCIEKKIDQVFFHMREIIKTIGGIDNEKNINIRMD